MQETGNLPDSSTNDHVHVVLVQTIESLNIGSAARAMMNLGFSNLHLVAPRSFDINKASVTACWAADLLKQARVHDSLEEALSGMQEVVGFSAREEAARPGKLLLPEWVEKYKVSGEKKQIALLFGPEDSGLSPEHVEQCHWIVRIPSTAACPSFNLAQSVVLALFEISRLRWQELQPVQSRREMPDWNQYYQLDRIVDDVLAACRFFREGAPAPIPGLIKNLFRRMEMDEREMRVMLALFARIRRSFLAGIARCEEDFPESDPSQ